MSAVLFVAAQVLSTMSIWGFYAIVVVGFRTTYYAGQGVAGLWLPPPVFWLTLIAAWPSVAGWGTWWIWEMKP